MGSLFTFKRLVPKGNGRLSRIEHLVDIHSRVLENIEVEGRLSIRRTANGSFAISSRSSYGASDTDFYAFKIFAELELVGNPPAPADPPTFKVAVLGGPAQALGGVEWIYQDYAPSGAYPAFTGIANGEYFWVRFNVWDENAVPVLAWEQHIQHGLSLPNQEGEDPKFLIFCLGRVGTLYRNFVRQDRLGAIVAAATVNASPDFSQVQTLPP